MTPMTSRLIPLLHVRQGERDQCRVELAEALHALDVVRQQLAELAREMGRAENVTRAATQPGVLNVDRLRNIHHYVRLLELRRQQLQQREAAMEQVVQGRRESLLDANQQVRTLEKLLDVESQKRDLATRRAAQRHLDEIAQRPPMLPCP